MIISTMFCNSSVYLSESLIELLIAFLSVVYLLLIVSPALVILLDSSSIAITSIIIQSLGYQ